MADNKIRDSINAVLVIGIPIALFIFVDENLLWKLALAALAFCAAAVFGIFLYMTRLDTAMQRLPENVKDERPFDVGSLPLKPIERQLLGINDIAHPERIRRVLKGRRSILESIAMVFAICALIAFITLIGVFAD